MYFVPTFAKVSLIGIVSESLSDVEGVVDVEGFLSSLPDVEGVVDVEGFLSSLSDVEGVVVAVVKLCV